MHGPLSTLLLISVQNKSKSQRYVHLFAYGFHLKKLILLQDFVSSILALDKRANVIVAGDFNEFVQTRSVFAPFDGILTEIDESSGLDPVERYTYIFDQSCQQLVSVA
jgi:hypothetical protein